MRCDKCKHWEYWSNDTGRCLLVEIGDNTSLREQEVSQICTFGDKIRNAGLLTGREFYCSRYEEQTVAEG